MKSEYSIHIVIKINYIYIKLYIIYINAIN